MSIKVYAQPGCLYCKKVFDKLDELGLEYEVSNVPSNRAARDEVMEVSGQRGVPVLVDDEHGVDGMNESDDIVRYLEETYAE